MPELITLNPAPVDPAVVQEKLQRLAALLRELGSLVVGFSGGVDSTLVAAAAHQALGPRALAVIARSASYPRAELDLAVSLARERGWQYRIIETDELANPNYVRNDASRCYHCKTELFTHLRAIAEAEGYAHIAYGANVDDMADFRPGHRAAQEWRVRSPLYEVGFAKPEIREAARQLGLPNWDKPAMACLSSRIPYGTPVTPETLARIECAENVLRELGLRQFRVRHHNQVARIEIPPEDWAQLLAPANLERVIQGIRAAGYLYVTLDLQGFRSGSLNEALQRP